LSAHFLAVFAAERLTQPQQGEQQRHPTRQSSTQQWSNQGGWNQQRQQPDQDRATSIGG
jgi:hypothetical protein